MSFGLLLSRTCLGHVTNETAVTPNLYIVVYVRAIATLGCCTWAPSSGCRTCAPSLGCCVGTVIGLLHRAAALLHLGTVVVPQTGYDYCLAATTDSRWTHPRRLTVASGAGARRRASEAQASLLTGACSQEQRQAHGSIRSRRASASLIVGACALSRGSASQSSSGNDRPA